MEKAMSAAASFQAHVCDTHLVGIKGGYRIGTDIHENCTWICHWQMAGLMKRKATRSAPRFLISACIKQDTKQQQTGKDLEMAEYLLL